jgi:rRNA maturation RNase YbeY
MKKISVFNAHPRYRRRREETIRLVRRVLSVERCPRAEIGIVFVNDKKMVELNGTYLHHYYTTDVLSFPFEDSSHGSLEGEVYVNLDQAKRQAAQYKVALAEEARRLVIHGVLHLVGYDDVTRRQQNAMRKLEDRYLM